MFELTRLSELSPIKGVRLSAVAAGIRKIGKQDLCLIETCPNASLAGVFTQNIFCAAPVIIAREHISSGNPQLLVINSGNANAGTGKLGLEDALDVCRATSARFGLSARDVLPFSTGVIGQRLPAAKIIEALPKAQAELSENGWEAASRAIMTTDTVPKAFSVQVRCNGRVYSVTGVAKGAGMIKPNMATMLAFIATDAAIPQTALTDLIKNISDRTFNRITIDGDTSTNDSCIVIATGQNDGNQIVSAEHSDWGAVSAGIEDIASQLAKAIVRDGEGATKLVTVDVSGGESVEECLKAAYAVAESPLVKTALFASDPNWGRILAAVGRSGVRDLRMSELAIAFNDYPIVAGGEPVRGYDEAVSAKIMALPEFNIRISIGTGPARTAVLTCDFSLEYVRINAEYRS